MPIKKEPVEELGASLEMTLDELALLLIKHYELHEGLFNLSVQFQIGTGAIGPDKENLLPGAMIGLSGIGLMKVPAIGPNTLDAAMVNPAKKPSRSNKAVPKPKD